MIDPVDILRRAKIAMPEETLLKLLDHRVRELYPPDRSAELAGLLASIRSVRAILAEAEVPSQKLAGQEVGGG